MKKTLLSLFLLSSFFLIQDSYCQMFWNQAASFNGSINSYLSVPHSSALGLTGSFTLEAWVCPDLTASNNGVFGKSGSYGGSNNYGLRITSGGRVQIITNGSSRISSRIASLLQENKWTHICGTYDSASSVMAIYINGALDTTATVPSAVPTVTADSLFIGIAGSTIAYKGLLDEARIWNRALTASEISRYFRATLSASSGVFKNLIYSLTFQDNESQGTDFSLTDWTHNSADAVNHGVDPVDLSNRPSNTIYLSDHFSNSVGGSRNYAAAPDDDNISPSTELTIELWYAGENTSNRIIVQKGPGPSENANYGIGKQNNGAYAMINGFKIPDVNAALKDDQYNHIAFTYKASTGEFHFYINGAKSGSGIYAGGNIVDGTDSLYIGASPGTADIFGRIDELRISNRVKSYEEICEYMYKTIEASNDPPGLDAVYSFDGTLEPSVDSAPRLTFHNGATFGQCLSLDNYSAPTLRNDPQNFSNGFIMKPANKEIPTIGSMAEDTLRLINAQTISDINVFIGLEHRKTSDLRIFLVSPDNDVIQLYNHDTTIVRTTATVFDDNADSSLGTYVYASYSPEIKPYSSINSILSGKSSGGFWKLRIIDDVASNAGILYAWGIQVNNTVSKPYVMNVSALIQGFYDSLTNNSIRDTMRFRLREATAPYSMIESKKNYFNLMGFNSIEWNSVSSGVPMYIQLTHRNSIETWSSQTIEFDPFTKQVIYDFRDAQSASYGSNSLQLDTSPLRFGNYTGDPNQDGVVNLTDITAVYNASTTFITGYVLPDVNGNSIVNLADLVLTYNNAQNFVSSEHP